MIYRIGCLGAARIAPAGICEPAHVVGGVALHAIAARDRDRGEAFAREHGFATVHADYAGVVNDTEVSLIYNPLPVHLHADWSIRALQAGKHVLCEKPLAMNSIEARNMVDAAASNQRRLIEAFHYRYHPAFQQLLSWVEEDRIGPIEHINAFFTVPIPDRDGTDIRHLPGTGGGAFMDLGTYPLHWARQVMGSAPEILRAQSVLTPRGVDETLTTTLGFASNVEAKLHASMAPDQPIRAGLEITGRTGQIIFENPLSPHLGGRLRLQTKTEDKSVPISRISTYTYQLAAVVSALDSGLTLATEGDDIVAQQAALDGIYVAADLGHLRNSD